MKLVIMILLVFALGGFGKQLVAAQPRQNAIVTFRVVDVFGRPLPYFVDKFTGSSSAKDLAPRFSRGLHGADIPFGVYQYRLLRLDVRETAGWLTGTLDVRETEVIRVLLGSEIVARIGNAASAISVGGRRLPPTHGWVIPPPKSDTVCFRLKAVYQSYEVDVPVDADGIFAIPETLKGLFVLLVLRNGGVVGLQLLAFGQTSESRPLTIDLEKIKATCVAVGAVPVGCASYPEP